MSSIERVFALAYDPVTTIVYRRFKPHREYLAAGISGTVLALGVGTGKQLPYFEGQGADLTVHGIDPNPWMLERGTNRAGRIDLEATLTRGIGESLPYADDSFDVVVSSMTMCTVDDLDAVLTELERVLRQGGELRLFEHVADDGINGRLQRTLNPFWCRLAAGCQLTRSTGERVTAHDAFERIETETLSPGFPLVRPFIRGRYRHTLEDT